MSPTLHSLSVDEGVGGDFFPGHAALQCRHCCQLSKFSQLHLAHFHSCFELLPLPILAGPSKACMKVFASTWFAFHFGMFEGQLKLTHETRAKGTRAN